MMDGDVVKMVVVVVTVVMVVSEGGLVISLIGSLRHLNNSILPSLPQHLPYFPFLPSLHLLKELGLVWDQAGTDGQTGFSPLPAK